MPFEQHPNCVNPNAEDVQVWRYMDLAKFLWTLEHESLYFCRLDMLEDAFEGALPASVIQPLVAANKSWYNAEKYHNQTLPGHIVDMYRNSTFVNCWHMNEHESAAMWDLYGGAGSGIAIQSTYRHLKASFDQYSGKIFIGVVRYIDFSIDVVNPYSGIAVASSKRKSFEHEREIRVFAHAGSVPDVDLDKLSQGLPTIESIIVPVNIGSLIEHVHVSPRAPRWFGELVELLLRRYSYTHEVVRSALFERPLV